MRGMLHLQQLLCYASCNSNVGAGACYTVLESPEDLHHWQSLHAHHLKHGTTQMHMPTLAGK
jgi:transcription initiation factor TFIID subunit TAF12